MDAENKQGGFNLLLGDASLLMGPIAEDPKPDHEHEMLYSDAAGPEALKGKKSLHASRDDLPRWHESGLLFFLDGHAWAATEKHPALCVGRTVEVLAFLGGGPAPQVSQETFKALEEIRILIMKGDTLKNADAANYKRQRATRYIRKPGAGKIRGKRTKFAPAPKHRAGNFGRAKA